MGSGGDGRTRGKAARRGGTFICVGSGSSLARWQREYIRDKAVTAVATNTSFKAIDRGICYGCDGIWWNRYAEEVRGKGIEGWTQDIEAAQRHGLNYIKGQRCAGLYQGDGVALGRNSGYQAIGLAYYLGAERIVLIGYDMKVGAKSHWHGDHPRGLRNAESVSKWVRDFDALAADLKTAGVDAINCTIDTALTCFPRADLRDVL